MPLQSRWQCGNNRRGQRKAVTHNRTPDTRHPCRSKPWCDQTLERVHRPREFPAPAAEPAASLTYLLRYERTRVQCRSKKLLYRREIAGAYRACGRLDPISQPERKPYRAQIQKTRGLVPHPDKDQIDSSSPGRSRTRSLAAAQPELTSAGKRTEY